MSWLKSLAGFFSRKTEHPDIDVEALRLDFKVRYHSFKLLIKSNNKTLENMAEIEQALAAKEQFGMAFIRSRITAVAVNVFSMIKYMQTIAPGKYAGLSESFTDIQNRIEELLKPKKSTDDTRLVLPFSEIGPRIAGLVGQKMANVADVKNRLGLNVPNGFVVTAAAYDLFMKENNLQDEIYRIIQATGYDDKRKFDIISSTIRQAIMDAPVPEPLAAAIITEWDKLEQAKGGPIRLALRSSAIGEDSHASSFAGQYRSELNISRDGVFEAYKEVLASKYSVQAINYKLNRGFRDEDISMCVGFMEMVEAVSGGVVYTGNPVDDRDSSVYINASLGLPLSVVDGSDTSDLFVVARKTDLEIVPSDSGLGEAGGVPGSFFSVTKKEYGELVRSDIREKHFMAECLPIEGIHRAPVDPGHRNTPALTADQVMELYAISLKIEAHYGKAQDIEWALDRENRLFVLQCRPLKQLHVDDGAALIMEMKNLPPLAEGSITASPGVGWGTVYHVSKMADVFEFPQGAVMVVEQALPAWAALISRASGLVSEQGSFAGHLANVAREFNVPAVFAVPDALHRIPQGTVVTVDADAKKIYEGKIDALLVRERQDPPMMEGTQVYELLKKASRHIVPLNLLRPESPEFTPENCRTFHDITRFIHEKSVHEMFNFGDEHHFSEHTSKQLFYQVPMKWWILNLDDGFAHEVNGKYVKVEEIVSIPMRAFWAGFVAKPWEGPPPIDGRGFAAVMFQSTTQTNLNVGVASKFADRNYFMLSKNYCSLSSRLGYHFSTMEAMVSDRSGENYIGFQFKGGAADKERREKRVLFIGEILERYGFRVTMNQDNLKARIEGFDQAHMEKRLEILGFLSLHTRQLDMIMTNPARVAYYREKLIRELDGLIGF